VATSTSTVPERRATFSVAGLLASRPRVDLDAEAERAWRLHRHGLAERVAGLDDLARRHVGLHAARQLTPWMTLHSRLPHLPPVVLRTSLRDRKLLRVRCMRRTLHLLPVDLAAVAHTATLRQRLLPCELASRRLGLAGQRRRRLEAEIVGLLGDGPRRYDELLRTVAADTCPRAGDLAIERARQAIKNLWETGTLVVGDASDSLHHEQRTFARTDLELGAGALTVDPATAVRRLLRHYLHAYGPVTPKDFAWWSGISLGEAAPAWEALADELVRVRVAGLNAELVALGPTVAELLDGDWTARPVPHTSVLAYEDPSLKGYFATRSRYIAPVLREQLFNSIGEARASVMVDGMVAAVWAWDRDRQSAQLDLRNVHGGEARDCVHDAVAEAVAFLRSEPRTGAGVLDARAVRPSRRRASPAPSARSAAAQTA